MDKMERMIKSVFRICMTVHLFLIFTDGQQVSVVDVECQSHLCLCCATTNCNEKNGDCLDGCMSGHHGGRCFNLCPEKCANCTDHPSATSSYLNGIAYCRECIEGYYSTSNLYQCQSQCGSHCVCTFNSSCTSCKKDYCLNKGECQYCPSAEGCHSCGSTCDCYSCQDGYYFEPSGQFEATGICQHCPDGCISCSSLKNCSSCFDGYYKSKNAGVCEQCSEGCIDGRCQFENGHCDCLDYFHGDKCDVCIPGRRGQKCNLRCSENCANISCDRDTGDCYSCKHNLVLPKCEQCTEGLYGLDCNISCPQNCLNLECERFTGHCFNCTEKYSGLTCRDCSDWRYGKLCDQICPVNCFGTLCDRNNGSCISCMPGFTGSKCDKCMDGKYGAYCSFSCSDSCANQLCNNRDGECFECNKAGSYGKFCDQDCPKTCKNATCNRKTGQCDYGCIEGYSGDRCCLNNTFCAECIPNGVCSRCINGKYGENCSLSCNEGCMDNRCHKLDGFCLSCEGGGNNLDCSISDVPVTGVVLGSIGGVTIAVALSIIGYVECKEN